MPGEDEKSKFEIWLEKFLNGINSENISEELKFLATAIVKKQKLEDVQNVSDDLKKFAKQIVFDDSNFLLVASSKSLGDDQNLKLASSSFEKLTSQAKLFELLANYDQYNRALTSTKSVNTIVFNQQARTYNSSHENDKIWTLQIRNEENEILTAIFKGGLMIDCLKDASKEEIEKRKDPTTNEDAKDLASEFKKLIEKNHYKITHNEKDFEMQIAAEEVSDILEGDDKAVKSAYLSDVAGTGAGDGACAGAGTGAGAVQRICDEFCQTKQRISYEYCQTKAVESASLSAVAGFGAGAGAGAGVGALVGATVGGILGSVVPGAGTLAGATGGALIGAKVGAFAGAGTGACTAFFTGWQYGSSYNKASGKLINREEVETKNNEFSPFHALIEGGKAGALAGAWAGAASSAGAVVGPVCAAHAAGAFAGKAVVAQLVGSSAARGVVGAVKGGSEGGIGGFFWGFGRGIVVGEGAWLGECGNVFHITESAGAQIGVTALGATFDVTKAKWQGEGNIALILTSSALSGVEIVAANEFSSAYYLESHYNKVYNEAGSDSFFQRELINPIQATADAVKHDFWHNNSEFFHKVEAEQNKIAIHLSQLDLSLKEELSKLGFVLDKKEHQELSSSDLVLRDSTLHNMFLQHKESLNNSHDVLATLGLLKKDDFKFADPHTAQEMDDELNKMMDCLNGNKGKLDKLHDFLVTFDVLQEDGFKFSHSHNTATQMCEELTKMMDCLNNNKERLDNAHNLLVNSGLLPKDDFKDDFKFADSHTAQEMDDEFKKMIDCLNGNKGKLDKLHDFLVTFDVLQEDGFKFSHSHNTATQMCDELNKMMNCLYSNKERLDKLHDVLVNFGLLKKDDFKFADPHTAQAMDNELNKMMDCLNNNKERLDNAHNLLVNSGLLPKDDFKFADSYTAQEMDDELNKMMDFLDSNKDKLNTMHNYLVNFGLLKKDDFKFADPHTAQEMDNQLHELNKMMDFLDSNKGMLDNLHHYLATLGLLQEDGFKFSHSHNTATQMCEELTKMMDCLNNNKERLDNAHNLLVNSGLLPKDDFKDDFKFADPHTAKEINHELSKIIKGFGQLNIIHNSLNTIFPPKINDDFQFSASGDVNIMSTKLNEMQKFLQESGFQDFVKTVGIGGVEISDIKETTNISNLKDHFDKLREAICDNFHKSYDSSNDSSKITTFEDLKKHYHYYVDEKAKAEAAVKAQAQAAAEAEAEQRAQDNADNDPGRVKITVENTLQISSTDVGGIKIITSSNSNEPFVYDKLYELPTKDGFKVYGLSSDGGKEISGLVIMKGNEVLGFERSVLGIGNRHVNCFIKNEDTNTWTSFSYITLGVDPSGIDKSNDDGVLLEQKFAQLLNSALNQEVASPDQGHLWTPGDNKLFPACFGENRLLTIFNQATEVPILTILNQATEVPSDCIEGVSCSSLVGIIRSNYE